MAEPIARFRLFERSDDKEVRFIIGKSNMEPLAVANQRAYFHPLTISLWFGLSCIFIEFMNWWPNFREQGYPGYLTPLPAFAAIAVPILALVDWVNRPYFEESTKKILHHPDMIDIQAYYAQYKASGLWILEYDKKSIGIIAIDANPESESNPDAKKRSKKPLSSSVAVIRHFYVDEPYRPTQIQDDLLRHAVKHAFSSDPTLDRIEARDSPLTRYAQQSLKSAGFRLEQHTETVGLFRWKLGTRVLERAEWKKSEEASET